jgi:hypothetical protein
MRPGVAVVQGDPSVAIFGLMTQINLVQVVLGQNLDTNWVSKEQIQGGRMVILEA